MPRYRRSAPLPRGGRSLESGAFRTLFAVLVLLGAGPAVAPRAGASARPPDRSHIAPLRSPPNSGNNIRFEKELDSASTGPRRDPGGLRLIGAESSSRAVGVPPGRVASAQRRNGVSPTSAPGQHWPSFRGPGATGVADDTNPPVRWDVPDGRNLAWKTPIPGLAHSSPIVWGDRVFVTTAVSELAESPFRADLTREGDPASDHTRHRWFLYCLELSTGRVLWSITAHEGTPRSLRHLKSSQASSTPSTDGRYVVAFFGSEGLFCFTVDGELVWTQDLGVLDAGSTHYPERQWGVASSPVISDGRVIVQCDQQKGSFVAAFELATGRRLWTTERDEIPSWASPTVHVAGGRRQVVTNAGRFIRGYDLSTGRELWRLANTSDIAIPTPVAAGDFIIVTSGYQPAKPIYAIHSDAEGDISLADGRETSPYIAWSTQRGGPYIPTPLVYGAYLFTNSSAGVLACYEVATGKLIYQRRIADRGGGYSASPVAADGRLYLSSEDGEVHVVRAGPDYELLASNRVGETLMATPALAPGLIIVRGLKSVFALASETP